jgi:hypothetical protein
LKKEELMIDFIKDQKYFENIQKSKNFELIKESLLAQFNLMVSFLVKGDSYGYEAAFLIIF